MNTEQIIIVAPTPMPFKKNEKLDLEALANNTELWLTTKLDGFVIGTAGGEEAYVTQKEKYEATKIISEDGNTSNSQAEASMGIGFICGILIYMFIFMYGTMVMRGVIEEKTSRIVEVIISSVKPFQLMMGKILGVALVGLTQFVLWILLTFVIATIAEFAFINPSSMTTELNPEQQSIILQEI